MIIKKIVLCNNCQKTIELIYNPLEKIYYAICNCGEYITQEPIQDEENLLKEYNLDGDIYVE